jgi:hypothetical protein
VSKPFTDIDGKALEALITRVVEAKENNLALSPEDYQLLLDALLTLATTQTRLANDEVTVHKLRKLFTGQSPFKPEQYVMERLRCNACGAYFTEPLPIDVLTDGTYGQKYSYSARSLMAIYKYFAGLPFYRQSSIQKLLGVKITASTVFDQVELFCHDIYPVYQLLFNLAADGKHYYLDGTTNRILDAKPIEKKARNSDKMRTRTGVYSSGVIATIADNRQIVLFETNIGHAGEFIDSILHKRSQSCAKPLIMGDAIVLKRC